MIVINSLINTIQYKNIIPFDQTSGSPLGNLFVVVVLMILIIFSLMLTFSEQSAAIHKVLGLLLVSLFVVSLWMFETHFLFVYLVYILAFVGAVLMLFLSVVLMLPISTLKLPSKVNNLSVFVIFISEGLNYASYLIIIFITLQVVILLSALLITTYKYISKINLLTARDGHSFSIYIRFVLSFILSVLDLWNWFNQYTALKINWNELINNDSSYYIKNVLNFFRIKDNTVYSWLDKYINNQPITFNKHLEFNNSKIKININYNSYWYTVVFMFTVWLTFAFVVFKLFLTWFLFVFKFLKQRTIGLFKLIRINFINMAEWLIQGYLTLTTFVILIPVHYYYNKNTLSINELLSSDSESGLANIKVILYEKPGFLLISTLVLLVALMGAAIMTRGTKRN